MYKANGKTGKNRHQVRHGADHSVTAWQLKSELAKSGLHANAKKASCNIVTWRKWFESSSSYTAKVKNVQVATEKNDTFFAVEV